jgi:hypothetical protein
MLILLLKCVNLFFDFVFVACKNVVVPERVVHALNRRVEDGMIRDYMKQKNRFYETLNNENNG